VTSLLEDRPQLRSASEKYVHRQFHLIAVSLTSHRHHRNHGISQKLNLVIPIFVPTHDHTLPF
jgi:hypothetical protein